MKTVRFILFFAISITLAILLNKRVLQEVPPLGKFLSPFQGFLQNAESADLTLEDEITLDGLKGSVQVYYDELHIPHIYAANSEDLHRVQGYLTARDRLWQMDFLSRLIYGRLSEVVGERALSLDRYNRRIGLKKMTQTTFKKLQESDPQLLANAMAYSEGVNAYIEELEYKDYPIEFKLLNYAPERWSAEKSCMAYAMLSNDLSRSEADLENTNALQIFGRKLFDLLYPEQIGNLSPVIKKEKPWDFKPDPIEKPKGSFPLILTPKTFDKPHPLNGSNNFAISGSRTKSGNVLLANEPDLQLTLPSIWHAVHLHSPDKNVMGVTVPGTPLILIGFNNKISWGVTNSPRDQVDWFQITFRDASRKEYLYNNQWFKSEKVIEKYSLPKGKTFIDTIIYTHHGPVIYDQNLKGDSGKINYAMRWIAHDPTSSMTAMNAINKATDYKGFVNALKKFQGPPQNFIFGSTSGDIALWLPGKFPVKWKEQGKFLMDGSNIDHEWKRYIPFEHYAFSKNPEKGYLSSANQHPVDSLYPYYTYDHRYEYYRGRRIEDRLDELKRVEPKDMMKLQNDNFNFMASESLPVMIEKLDSTKITSPKAQNYLSKLKKWDYFNHPDETAPTLYQIWWDIYYQTLWDEFDTIQVAIEKPNKYVTIQLMTEDKLGNFTDIRSSKQEESLDDVLFHTFKQAVDSLGKLTEDGNLAWSSYKNTTVRHLLRLDAFSREGVEIGGYSSIVNAASRWHGPSWRMVVELDPSGTKAWGVYPGSQTGNPGSPMYGHMIDKWASGQYHELLFGRDVSRSDKVIFHQVFLTNE